MEQPPIFVCSNCNVGFPSPGKNDLGISDEKLRKAWHEKVDYFLTRPLSIEDEKLFASCERASMAYLSKLNNGCWKFPYDTMATINNKLICLQCSEKLQKSKTKLVIERIQAWDSGNRPVK